MSLSRVPSPRAEPRSNSKVDRSMLGILLTGCTLISDGEIAEKLGAAPDSGSADTDSDTDSDSDSDADYRTAWGSEMIAISAGNFTDGGGAEMGAGRGDPMGGYTDHDVRLTHDFWIGQTELTRGEWETFSPFLGWTYSSLPDFPCTTSNSVAACPADTVSWYNAAKYCNALSQVESLVPCYLADGTGLAEAYVDNPYLCPGYRLPTEAEWEYAARAGLDTEFSGANTATAVAWYAGNAFDLGEYGHEVATKAPNDWGLYDMSGNVWEWTNDWHDLEYGLDGSGRDVTDPAGAASGSYRVYRGGDWSAIAAYSRLANRAGDSPDSEDKNIGFRLARSVP